MPNFWIVYKGTILKCFSQRICAEMLDFQYPVFEFSAP